MTAFGGRTRLPARDANRQADDPVAGPLIDDAADILQRDRVAARHARHHGVRIAVPGSKERVHVPLQVSVRDNGPGIPEAVRATLFEPFVTTKRGGQGLGLALVAKLDCTGCGRDVSREALAAVEADGLSALRTRSCPACGRVFLG